MACKCNLIIKHIENIAPTELIQNWDNAGLLLGDSEQEINKILLALDITREVVDEAVQRGVELIITHHPVIFKPVSNLKKDNPQGELIIKLIQNNISVYSAHSNLDLAQGGVNDTLAGILGLKDVEVLQPVYNIENVKREYGFAKIGRLNQAANLITFAQKVKNLLNIKNIKLVGDINKNVEKVIVSSGSYSGIAKAAKDKGGDVIVTGDLKYHDARDILSYGLSAVDAGHFATENIILPVIAQHIEDLNMGLEVIISDRCEDIFQMV